MREIQSRLPKREEIDEQYKWRISDLFSDETKWYQECEYIRGKLKNLEDFKGKILNSPKELYNCLKLKDEISISFEKVFNYADLNRYVDRTNAKYQILGGKADLLDSEIKNAFSFIKNDLLSLSTEEIYKLSQNEDLKTYRFYLEELIYEKEHALSPENEKLLNMLSPIFNAPRSLYSMLVTADSKPAVYVDKDGNEIELTPSTIAELRNRLPKEEFVKIPPLNMKKYQNNKNTIATSLDFVVRNNCILSSIRKYSSPRQMLLQDIPEEIYDNLVNTVRDNVHLMAKYQDIRKKMLKLSDIDYYDMTTPIVTSVDRDITYDEAKKIIALALAPLDQELVNYFHYLTECGSIDLYENVGKEGGAFCCSMYDSHPFILLNFQHRLSDIYALAHECGHAFHSYCANKTQDYIYTTGTRFIGEIPSIVNEILLLNYLIDNASDPNEKIYWKDAYIGKFHHVLFGLTRVAEFEKLLYEKVSEGEILTPALLSSLWDDLGQQYGDLEPYTGEEINVGWARHSLFLTSPFYIYQYSTSFCAAVDIAKRIQSGDKLELDGYLNMLKGGSSDKVPKLIEMAGIDILSTNYIKNALKVLETLIQGLEEDFVNMNGKGGD